MKEKLALIFIAALMVTSGIMAQCTNNNALLMNYTPTPCNSTTQVITNCIQGGQYVAVAVTSGTTYTFSTCGNTAFDTQITLFNNAGGTSIGYNDDGCGSQSTITWTATFTGVVRVL